MITILIAVLILIVVLSALYWLAPIPPNIKHIIAFILIIVFLIFALGGHIN